MIKNNFHIHGLRHNLFNLIKTKIGIKGYQLVLGIVVVALATAIILPLTMSANKKDSFAAGAEDTSGRKKVVDVRFLNTEKTNSDGSKSDSSSNLIKAGDQTVLTDTGSSASNSSKDYDAIKSALGGEGKTIDYLIITHMHEDHYGNAVKVIQNYKVRNLVIKWGQETSGRTQLDNIIRAFRKKAYDNRNDRCLPKRI